jgi:PAS domain S-box-containing protein
MPRVLAALGAGLGGQVGAFWKLDPARDELRPASLWASPALASDAFVPETLQTRLRRGVGLPGRVCETDTPEQVDDLGSDANFVRRETALKAGLRYGLAFPVKAGAKTLGIVEMFASEPYELEGDFLDTVTALGQQIGQFVMRKSAEEELRESEALKDAILEASLDCIVTIDSASRIVEWNPAAEQTFGYRRDTVLGKSLAGMIIPPEYRERHYEGMRRYLEQGEGPVLGKKLELEALRSDGSRFPVELVINAIDLGGRPHFTASLRDISGRKAGEEA